MTCWRCGKKGHFANSPECPQNNNRKEQAAQAREEKEEDNQEDLEAMFRFEEQAHSAKERRRPYALKRKQARRRPTYDQRTYMRNEQRLRKQLREQFAELTKLREECKANKDAKNNKEFNTPTKQSSTWNNLNARQKRITERRVEALSLIHI